MSRTRGTKCRAFFLSAPADVQDKSGGRGANAGYRSAAAIATEPALSVR